ncbi:hypothetical protein GQR58_014396 [Nymphon striatum]|nr:hypothetical protein GQR58_014396 [Nymphon striatum]
MPTSVASYPYWSGSVEQSVFFNPDTRNFSALLVICGECSFTPNPSSREKSMDAFRPDSFGPTLLHSNVPNRFRCIFFAIDFFAVDGVEVRFTKTVLRLVEIVSCIQVIRRKPPGECQLTVIFVSQVAPFQQLCHMITNETDLVEVVGQPPRSNGSVDTVTSKRERGPKEGVAISAISPSVANVLPTKYCSWTFN